MTNDRRFVGANVGVLTGLSGVTVVDIDAPAELDEVVELFGHTPLKTRTPHGGFHLWYAAGGERNRNLRPHGMKVDIKGVGGFVVVPPSVQPNGLPYVLTEGDWPALATLPRLSPGGRDFLSETGAAHGASQKSRLVAPIGSGQRNNRLFREALQLARGMTSEAELVDELSGVNIIFCDPPLGQNEVVKTARSAWRYTQDGRNFTACGGFTRSFDLKRRIGDPDAFWLYASLVEAHGAATSENNTNRPFRRLIGARTRL